CWTIARRFWRTAPAFWPKSSSRRVWRSVPIRASSKRSFGWSCDASFANARAAGRSCCPSSWRSDVGGSTASRRVSEFLGVALFAAALIWIIALASYDPGDPVWYFTAGSHSAPVANFAGRVGAFLAELSFQIFGYASYFIPALLVVTGWNYFWCRSLDAAGTKATGAFFLLTSLSTFLSL